MFLLINCDLKLKNRIYPKILIQSLPNTFFCKSSSFALKIHATKKSPNQQIYRKQFRGHN